jgi:hypothetical protein
MLTRSRVTAHEQRSATVDADAPAMAASGVGTLGESVSRWRLRSSTLDA